MHCRLSSPLRHIDTTSNMLEGKRTESCLMIGLNLLRKCRLINEIPCEPQTCAAQNCPSNSLATSSRESPNAPSGCTRASNVLARDALKLARHCNSAALALSLARSLACTDSLQQCATQWQCAETHMHWIAIERATQAPDDGCLCVVSFDQVPMSNSQHCHRSINLQRYCVC